MKKKVGRPKGTTKGQKPNYTYRINQSLFIGLVPQHYKTKTAAIEFALQVLRLNHKLK